MNILRWIRASASGGRLALGALSLLGLAGCSGAQFDVVAPRAQMPISMTAIVPDKDGTPLRIGRGLDAVGTYRYETTRFALFYGLTGSTLDLSDSVNQQVAAERGQAITGVRFTIEHCVINYFFPLTLLPFWPGCESVLVEGDIVRKTTEAVK